MIDTGSNEESGCDYYNEKNLNSFQCSVTENKTKKYKNNNIFHKLQFLVGFPYYLSIGTFQRVDVFALLSVYPDASFELSNTPVQ